MWVFGYGSLMWDGWESAHGCLRREKAVLNGFSRCFGHLSVHNWGSSDAPCPTLSLRSGGRCVGLAFEFPDTEHERIVRSLRDREGAHFCIEPHPVTLDAGPTVMAYVARPREEPPVADHETLERYARFAARAVGRNGRCRDYVERAHEALVALGIHDPEVESFWQRVSACLGQSDEEG
ncbi:MAG: gamma-glutamylcyclotransferase [Myxococcota bacterium]|nr:gamma-glutamylcyclotransferase [Myxococcota bacterium]